MGCQDVRNQLSAYLEGELDVAPRRVIEDHVRQCVRCQGELVLLQRTIALLRGLDEVEVPPSLSAAIQAGIRPRRRRWSQEVASWLFFPIHVKLPLQAVALLLVSLGAVYLYRMPPELAQAPAPPPVATERATRDQAPPRAAAKRSDFDARSPVRESAPPPAEEPKPAETLGRRAETQAELRKEREALPESAAGAGVETQEELKSRRQRDLVGALRKEAPAASRAAPFIRELTLKARDPSQAASRIEEIATAMGGRLVEASDPRQSAPEDLHRLALAIPPEAYPRFVNALRELGDLSPLAQEPPAAPSPEGTVIVYLHLIP
jgi:hypothetical protein